MCLGTAAVTTEQIKAGINISFIDHKSTRAPLAHTHTNLYMKWFLSALALKLGAVELLWPAFVRHSSTGNVRRDKGWNFCLDNNIIDNRKTKQKEQKILEAWQAKEHTWLLKWVVLNPFPDRFNIMLVKVLYIYIYVLNSNIKGDFILCIQGHIERLLQTAGHWSAAHWK